MVNSTRVDFGRLVYSLSWISYLARTVWLPHCIDLSCLLYLTCDSCYGKLGAAAVGGIAGDTGGRYLCVLLFHAK